MIALKNIHLDIASGDRIGLVGINGAGKTTLANILFGSIQPDEGSVTYHRQQMKVGYLLQSTSYTVNTFYNMISDNDEFSAGSEFLELTSHLGLKKVHEWNSERLSGLSGGEKTKLAIAHIWASQPDFLILDEPTNHLDFEGVEWLINELKTYNGTTLIISHDRYFLDQSVERILEIEEGVSTNYPGNYTFYREEKIEDFKAKFTNMKNKESTNKRLKRRSSDLKTGHPKPIVNRPKGR